MRKTVKVALSLALGVPAAAFALLIVVGFIAGAKAGWEKGHHPPPAVVQAPAPNPEPSAAVTRAPGATFTDGRWQPLYAPEAEATPDPSRGRYRSAFIDDIISGRYRSPYVGEPETSSTESPFWPGAAECRGCSAEEQVLIYESWERDRQEQKARAQKLAEERRKSGRLDCESRLVGQSVYTSCW